MRGGIQKGTTAYDSSSTNLNRLLTTAKNELSQELRDRGYTMKTGIHATQVPGGLQGINPDGGIWYDSNGKLVAAFEAKKQGSAGNAHERWYKNNAVILYLNPSARYVTFCIGAGVLVESSMYKGFAFALAREGKSPSSWNTLHRIGTSFYGSVNGFTLKEIKAVMRRAITGEA